MRAGLRDLEEYCPREILQVPKVLPKSERREGQRRDDVGQTNAIQDRPLTRRHPRCGGWLTEL